MSIVYALAACKLHHSLHVDLCMVLFVSSDDDSRDPHNRACLPTPQVDRIEAEKLRAVGLRNKVATLEEVCLLQFVVRYATVCIHIKIATA